MKIHGIRIFDEREDILSPILSDILEEISEGDSFNWSVLFIDGILKSDRDKSIDEFQNEINHPENGLSVIWEGLFQISSCFLQMYEILILGSKSIESLKRYSTDEDMYRSCDIVIELIDCAFWEIHTKDRNLINRLERKYHQVEIFEVLEKA